MEAIFLLSAVAVGGLLAVQASVNLQLTRAVGTPYGASTLQLAVAAVLLLVVAGVAGQLGALGELAGVAPWKLLGGIASPIYITSAILLFPRLGALASVGLFVTGQVLASLALDFGGLLGVPREPASIGVVVGAVAVLVGITAVIRGQGGAASTAASEGSTARGPWIALGLTAGAVLPIQGAINAALRREVREPITVALVSFTVATVTIVVVLLGLLALNRTPRPQLRPLRGMPWWGWLGGAAAATYVTATFLLIPVVGAATTVALTVTGQQIASAAVDQYGLFRLPSRRLTPSRLAGLAVLLGGSLLVQLS
ncbi:DMT family transporter [Dactylosporangium fulvum]|uniref:DMT family transporter n=1 Tax=Dactylosporangium fulvum TaxID=53359 RepID=A0ABY5VS68_9ACTN|nr:DMT family transporter [Dactylosporangium fulvum]UWP80052.1 DMT family transporter [Dactylosporangium fulvum]